MVDITSAFDSDERMQNVLEQFGRALDKAHKDVEAQQKAKEQQQSKPQDSQPSKDKSSDGNKNKTVVI